MMKNILNKRVFAVISIVMIISIVLTSFTYITRAGFTVDGWGQVNSINDLASLARNPEKFMSVSATTLTRNSLTLENGNHQANMLCVEHGVGSNSNSAKQIYKVVDMNFDGPNTLKINGTNQSLSYDEMVHFNALAEATQRSTVDGAAVAGGTGRDGAPFKSVIDYLCNTDPIEAKIGLNGGQVHFGSTYSLEGKSQYDEVIANGKATANGAMGEVKAVDTDDMDCQILESAYLGPFRYSYSEADKKISFYSIEITGDNGFSSTISSPSESNLYKKTSNGFVGVKNGTIAQNTDFYIKTSKSVDAASKIKVKINVAGASYYKSRMVIVGSLSGQAIAVYSIGNGTENKSDKSIEFEFDNNRGNLEIQKKGIYTANTQDKARMGFKIYYIDGNKTKYLKINDKSEITGTVKITKQEDTSEDKATIVYTTKSKNVKLKRIDSRHQYYLKEVSPDNSNYTTNILGATQKIGNEDASNISFENGVIGPITVNKKSVSTKTKIVAKDARKTGTLKLIKEDFDVVNKRVAEVKFKIQNAETNKWVKASGADGTYNLETYAANYSSNNKYYENNYTADENNATEFETNANGEITINGIDIGKYVIKEVYINNNNGTKNYGYTEENNPSNIDSKYVFWSIDGGKTKKSLAEEAIQLQVEDSAKTPQSTIYVYNKKKYIKITGKVWVDMPGEKGNDYTPYGENTYAEGDQLLDGITVRLKNKNGNVIKTDTTKNGGQYEFREVSREGIENGEYYVEFEYSGLTYTSVIGVNSGKENSPITSKAQEVVDQRKDLNKAFAEITNKDSINDRSHGYLRDANGNVTGTLTYKNDTENYQSIFESSTYNVNVTANTNVTGYSLEKEFKEGRYNTDTADDSFVIEHVNLGVVERMQPKLGLSNDIEYVQVDINNREHLYKYADRFQFVEDEQKSAFNVGVKFADEYVSEYTRAIYPSDVKYSSTDATEANKLKVYVTYSTTIGNLSNLKSSVNELANYYDKEYTIVDSWAEMNGDKVKENIKWYPRSKYPTNEGQTYNDGKYVGAYTTDLAETKISGMENLKVYIKFQVSDSAVLGLLSEKATLWNTSEIYSYSTYYGNYSRGAESGEENEIYAGIDQVSAPGNATPGKTETYETDTDKAPSLLLEAKGVREIEGTVFEDATDSEKLQSGKERKGNGEYDEGENIVKDVTVELIKLSDGSLATIYPPVEDNQDAEQVNTAKEGVEASKQTTDKGYYIFRGIEPDHYLIKYTYLNGTSKLFDTNGNEITDKEFTVQNYKSTIVKDHIKTAFEEQDKSPSDIDVQANWYKTDVDKRYSDARDDYAQREAIDNEIMSLDGTTRTTRNMLSANSPKFDIDIEYDTITTDAINADRFTIVIKNVDFGVVERPRQSATLDKKIANIKVTLANGNVLVNGNPKDNLDYVTIAGNTIYVTVDSELLYGAQIEIKYDLTLTNTGELDYREKSYYYTGNVEDEGNIVKLTGATLIDYVDSEMVLQEGQGETWNVVNMAEKGYNWNLTPEQEEALLKQYHTVVKAEPLSTSNAISPKEGENSITTPIIVEKLLSTNEDLSYDNNGEVVKIGKTGGSMMTTKLGSYASVLLADIDAEPEEINGIIETDEDKAETVTIIPPTGATNNNVTYAIIGVTSLAVLGAGAYGVRRFVKKQ